MGIKNWFENKMAERKAKAAVRNETRKLAKRYENHHRNSNHDASKRGYKHQHGKGFITSVRRLTEVYWNPKKVWVWEYKHGRNFGKKIQSNNDRVVIARAKRLGISVSDYFLRGWTEEWKNLSKTS